MTSTLLMSRTGHGSQLLTFPFGAMYAQISQMRLLRWLRRPWSTAYGHEGKKTR